MIGLAGHSLTPEERDILQHPMVAGVIFFSRNVANIVQLAELIADIRALRGYRFILAVDQEGGRVQRFGAPFQTLPSLEQLGHCYRNAPETGLKLAEMAAWLMAAELLSQEINMSFAPMVDLDRGCSKVMAGRCFSSEGRETVALAKAYMRGMHSAGMPTTLKHFPGHGSVQADTHEEAALDNRNIAELEAADDLQIFLSLLPKSEALMLSHVIYPNIDSRPVSFSAAWVEYIRKRYHFSGVLFSDDMCMAGAKQGCALSAIGQALEAGVDMVLICNEQDLVVKTLDSFHTTLGNSSDERLAPLFNLPCKPPLSMAQLQQTPRWRQAHEQIEQLAQEVKK